MAQTQHEEQLQSIFSNVNHWLSFAEAKNFGLLTLNAAIVFGFTQITFNEESIFLIVGYYWFLPFSYLSFLICLISLFPIVSKIEKNESTNKFISCFSNWIDEESIFENIHFYGYIKNLVEDDNKNEFEVKFLEKVGEPSKPFNGYEKDLAKQIVYNSRITWMKFQLFKIGAFFFLSGSILILIGLIIVKIYKCFA